jgi:Flp pilus assembly protein TadG
MSILAEESSRAASAEVVKLPSTQDPTASTGMTQQQKVAAALLKAGISNPAAWAAAGVAGNAGGTKVSANSADGYDSLPATVIMKGKNQSTFLISWRSQRDVARSLSWKCTLMIWGGPALTVLCLYGLLTLIHLI